jgi:hypothetical protein
VKDEEAIEFPDEIGKRKVYQGSAPQDEVKTYFMLICIDLTVDYRGSPEANECATRDWT